MIGPEKLKNDRSDTKFYAPNEFVEMLKEMAQEAGLSYSELIRTSLAHNAAIRVRMQKRGLQYYDKGFIKNG